MHITGVQKPSVFDQAIILPRGVKGLSSDLFAATKCRNFASTIKRPPADTKRLRSNALRFPIRKRLWRHLEHLGGVRPVHPAEGINQNTRHQT